MKQSILIFCLLFCVSAHAQTCFNDVAQTTPTSNFVDNGDGTVSDLRLGLMWMQCSVGQTWVEGTCQGDSSELNWQQALQFAHGFQFAGHDGWRVPNVKELSALTERQCVRPAINSTLFPDTPADDYWTSTPSMLDARRAWVVAFFNSSNSVKEKELFVFVRLVRSINTAN